MKYIIYFKSRKDMRDTSTWAKEIMPKDATIDEIREATKLGGCEGFAIADRNIKRIFVMEWIR